MTPVRRTLPYLCVSLFLAVVSANTFAQSNPRLAATAFAELPSDAIIEVRAGRDLPLERDLVKEVSKLLTIAGFDVAARGTIVVTVEGSAPLPGVSARNAFTNDDRLRSMETRRNDRGVQMQFNNTEAEPGAAMFTLRMSAYKPGGSNLWVGSVSGPDNGGGRRATTFALAKSLVDVFGQSTPKPPIADTKQSLDTP